MVELWRYLVDLYDSAKSYLTVEATEHNTAAPADLDVYTEMMTRLQPAYETRTDYTRARLAHTYSVPITLTDAHGVDEVTTW